MGKICLPCEREKARLPKYRELAKGRAIAEQKIMIVYFDTEDKKYYITDFETAKSRQIEPCEYFTQYA